MHWLIKRLARALFTIVATVSLSFVMIRLIPGGPMDYLRAQLREQNSGMSSRAINALVESYTKVNPDRPIHVQYVDYVTSVLQGDLGKSTWYGDPVSAILLDALPWTLFVMALSITFAFAIGIGLGALMAYKEGTGFDYSFSTVTIVFNSIPYYVLAVVFLFLLGFQWNLFPTGGRLSPGVDVGLTPTFLVDALYHAALPVLSFVLTRFGFQALAMRGNSINVLGENYLRVANIRGLPGRRIALQYVGRNAVLPLYTTLMISIGTMFGGTVILEQIFAYPGVGYYMFQAIDARDYPLMMGAFIVITVAIVAAILFADLTYGWIDPRAGGGESRETY
ncbi:MAG: ABC transporter permease [Haloarculaceae archaeon]